MIIVLFQSYMFSLFWACQNRLWVQIDPDFQLKIRVLLFYEEPNRDKNHKSELYVSFALLNNCLHIMKGKAYVFTQYTYTGEPSEYCYKPEKNTAKRYIEISKNYIFCLIALYF